MSENRLPGDYTKTQSLMLEEEPEQRNTIKKSQAVSIKTLKPAIYL